MTENLDKPNAGSPRRPVALTIAGSDPSGGAGLQADLATFHHENVYGMSVVTLLTVQNTQEVRHVETMEPQLVGRQLEVVLHDIPPLAAKTGALGSAGVIEEVARRSAGFDFPLVVDPVMISKHGHRLLDLDSESALRELLLPRAFLVTPNILEAAALAQIKVDGVGSMEQAAWALADMGCQNVLVKGGALPGPAIDVLFSNGKLEHFEAPRIETRNTHGSGCVFSAAITARLARGEDLRYAVAYAKQFVTQAIQTAPGLGHGAGPLNLFAMAE